MPVNPDSEPCCNTPTAASITALLGYCQDFGELGVVVGEPGVGKTAAVKSYVAGRAGVWLVTLSPSTSALVPCLTLICTTIASFAPNTGALDVRGAILNRLRCYLDPCPLIIDEAQHLSDQAIEEVRALHDQAGMAVVFVGNRGLVDRWQNKPGVKQIDFGYQGRSYRLNQDALDVKIPEESLGEAEKAIPGVDLGMRATNIGMNTIGLGVECDQAELATDPARYDSGHKVALAGADKWTDPDSDPITVIETGKEAVRTSTGLYPAVMVLSPDANRALRNHPKIIERFKFSGKATVTPEQLAELFDLRTVAVGKAVVADQAGAFHDVWKNCAVLAYVPENPNGNEEPSFGYIYTLKGNPITGKPYYGNGTKSWLFRVVHEWQPLVTGMAAGYFIQEPA